MLRIGTSPFVSKTISSANHARFFPNKLIRTTDAIACFRAPSTRNATRCVVSSSHREITGEAAVATGDGTAATPRASDGA
jgi:hypothetical protein